MIADDYMEVKAPRPVRRETSAIVREIAQVDPSLMHSPGFGKWEPHPIGGDRFTVRRTGVAVSVQSGNYSWEEAKAEAHAMNAKGDA